MVTGRFSVPPVTNEPIRGYAPGSPERASLEQRIASMADERLEAPMVIGGEHVTSGNLFEVRAPHRHSQVLAEVHGAERQHVEQAIDAALAAARDWAALPHEERAAIFLRAADLIAGPYRDTLNAATMHGQSKSVFQAEIDAACELIDFLRFNVAFAEQIISEQPQSAPGMWNRTDHRPLEGFVLAVSPFNFTAIAGNLPTAPALMGNVVVWKPSEKQALAAQHTMEVLEAAGLPPGVINLVHGDGAMTVDVATSHAEFAGLHFTGSTDVFKGIWRTVGERIGSYRTYPRLVGETGGKDFIVAHPSAVAESLVVAMGRGAFEYQGQKCSAASRAYVPRSLWDGGVRDGIADLARSLPMGDPTDLSTFMGAVIDERALRRHVDAVERSRAEGVEVLVGGDGDDSEGWFMEPTVLVTEDPRSDTMVRELFGPVLTVFVYDDSGAADATGGWWDDLLRTVDTTSPYALTGAVLATDRYAIDAALAGLRNSAGNFYVNDKPTGAVVGQQPFGGARASGTNDKAGSALNLLRWTSPRTLKETFVPPTDWRYPHLG